MQISYNLYRVGTREMGRHRSMYEMSPFWNQTNIKFRPILDMGVLTASQSFNQSIIQTGLGYLREKTENRAWHVVSSRGNIRFDHSHGLLKFFVS